jgi:hypothetical protein
MAHIVTLPCGFQVRFNLNGKKYDSVCFDSLDKAEAFKKELPHEAKRRKLLKNNTSGLNGIRLEWRCYRDNTAHPTLIVSYRKNNKTMSTSISLNKYGIDAAVKRALMLRGEMDEQRQSQYIAIIMQALK